MKKFGKYLPFVGDVVGFVIDLVGGIDWRRALMRAIAGASIDAGFMALMAALGLAAPFTGGASGVLATALYAAYMGVDIASGGFGRILGDKISDAFGWPMMAGQKDAPDPKGPGSEDDVKKLQKFFDKKAKQDPKFAKRVKDLDAAVEPKETKIPVHKPIDGPPPLDGSNNSSTRDEQLEGSSVAKIKPETKPDNTTSAEIKPADNNKSSSTAKSISGAAPYDSVGGGRRAQPSMVPLILPGGGKGNTQVPVMRSGGLPTGSPLNSRQAVLSTAAAVWLYKNQ